MSSTNSLAGPVPRALRLRAAAGFAVTMAGVGATAASVVRVWVSGADGAVAGCRVRDAGAAADGGGVSALRCGALRALEAAAAVLLGAENASGARRAARLEGAGGRGMVRKALDRIGLESKKPPGNQGGLWGVNGRCDGQRHAKVKGA